MQIDSARLAAMQLPFASQDHGVRMWAAVSSAILGVGVVVAGTLMLFSQRVFEDFGTALPALTLLAQRIGIGTLAATWLGYMASLIALLGYENAGWRRSFTFAVFVIAIVICFVMIVGAALPYTKVMYVI